MDRRSSGQFRVSRADRVRGGRVWRDPHPASIRALVLILPAAPMARIPAVLRPRGDGSCPVRMPFPAKVARCILPVTGARGQRRRRPAAHCSLGSIAGAGSPWRDVSATSVAEVAPVLKGRPGCRIGGIGGPASFRAGCESSGPLIGVADGPEFDILPWQRASGRHARVGRRSAMARSSGQALVNSMSGPFRERVTAASDRVAWR
jgi:hypothetical protein